MSSVARFFKVHMIRVLLYSQDPKLQFLLAPALKPECRVVVECRKEKLKEIVSSGEADILVLDLDSNYSSLPEQLSFYKEINDCPAPVVVMTDDLRQSTAIE